jgi:hypothetical protein
VDQRAVAAEQVDTDLTGGLIERRGDAHQVVRAVTRCDRRHRGHCDPPVDDGDAERALDLRGGAHQPTGVPDDLGVDLVAQVLCDGARAVLQVQAQRDGADVQVFLLEHPDRVEDRIGADHRRCLSLQPVGCVT